MQFIYYLLCIKSFHLSMWRSTFSDPFDRLESIQKWALKIITPCMPYDDARSLYSLTTLEERRDTLCRKLVNATTADTQHKLHGLLPTQRESGYGLRSNKMYPLPKLSTQRFEKSLINFGLFIYQ